MSQTLEIHYSRDPYFHEDENPEEEEEEEALSLCDLPFTSSSEIKGSGDNGVENQTENDSDFDFDFNFDFGSLVGSVTALESEMCAADELFFGGQMLPFRHSVSSDGGLSGYRVPIGTLPRSDSLDRVTGLGFGPSRSSSSRSSSTRSQQSVTSSISTSSSSSMGLGLGLGFAQKSKPGTHFHPHPSPNPQIRASGSRAVNPKSTMWQVLRLGLVRTPEIEFQDLKVRCRSSSNKNTNECNKIVEIQKNKNQIGNVSKNNKNAGGIFGSCKCTSGVIDPILMPRHLPPPPTVRNKSISSEGKSVISSQKQKQEEQQRKRVGSHHRTFEWLIRDISQTSVLNA